MKGNKETTRVDVKLKMMLRPYQRHDPDPEKTGHIRVRSSSHYERVVQPRTAAGAVRCSAKAVISILNVKQ